MTDLVEADLFNIALILKEPIVKRQGNEGFAKIVATVCAKLVDSTVKLFVKDYYSLLVGPLTSRRASTAVKITIGEHTTQESLL